MTPTAATPRGGWRWLRNGVLLLAALLVSAIVGLAFTLRASLPQLDGSIAGGNGSNVTLQRDALGVLTVLAASRADAAFGLGFAHAQDRLFQMDLARRLAAGELAELFGRAALPQDRKARRFRLRSVAAQAVAALPPDQHALLDAYTAGVNAGAASLGARPWEYWLLRSKPAAWRTEDSILVIHSMWWQLQYADIGRERFRMRVADRLRAVLPDAGAGTGADETGRVAPAEQVLRFLFARGTDWDAPNFATEAERLAALGGRERFESVAVPGPEVIDLRRSRPRVDAAATNEPEAPANVDALPGSNAWVVGGARVAGGGALVANDMHLGLGVPPVWYRARMTVAGDPALDLNGVTLAGVPLLVMGSNGHIAWGFTNPSGDWADVVEVSCDLAANRYTTNAGAREFEILDERIEVRGGDAEVLRVRVAPLGVLLDDTSRGSTCALGRWLVTEPGATNLAGVELETARSAGEALAVARRVGSPQVNFLVGDREGHIGWTLLGPLPRGEHGPSTASPVAWRTDGEAPILFDPEVGRIWSANARMIDGDAERIVGGDEIVGGLNYDLGARSAQIRDDLLALQGAATPDDMRRIQLDDRALFLARWRTMLLGVLDEEALKNQPQRAELRRLAERWDARADIGSVGYRVVREFRVQTERFVWQAVLGAVGVAAPLDGPPRQFEGALWRLVTEQPEHWLAPGQASWQSLLLAQVDTVIGSLLGQCGALARCAWGGANIVHIRHPLSRAVPFLSRWIDMPAMPLPGDHDMPRVQAGAFGASQRFAVSPGREAEGFLQLPGGQSGHPLSPYYRAGLETWQTGAASGFLPGASVHNLAITAN